jgi:hypothetical protein
MNLITYLIILILKFQLVIWHRYSEFKKLYQATKQLHAMLHRKEVFPSFAEAKVFGKIKLVVSLPFFSI